ncbi:outer membrane receptor for ferrienterochelin and colicins [Dysgonomonas sp. PH5-45]|uniref:TonB-dependent receptor n=1 Tax=unclassified Dysgonomonas TaxID=2630389 RepID=UPI002476AB48|nr:MULTISPECIES: TonB-dependent receptor [unclassified Dysgonomonas]MDH6354800.1 outer membrane receptor for ferrienterochelin and colicins [Dysgonomonas sp. PH5-45]MDH6387699.1 outer membrane receptor for ferrienterochelin and colicins [Dysgonomonas sp. PH5-37]
MKYKLLFILLLIPFFSFAAPIYKGYVVDSKKTPLEGALVFWEGGTNGVTTNEKGYFEITATPKDHMLQVSYLGYETVVLHAPHDTKEDLQIVLKENTQLEEVVINKTIAGRIKSRIDPLNTEKLSTRELSRAACCSLAESFDTNPSVDVSYNDAVTGARQIQLLGISGNYVQMLTENYPNFRGASKLYGLDYIPGPWMESIQISKGAASVKNGYESLSGQVNVEYKKPKEADPLSLNVFMSEASRYEANADGAIELNDKLSTGLLMHYSNEKKSHDNNDDSFLDMPKKHQFNVMNRWHYQNDNFISQTGVKFINDERTSGQTAHTMRKLDNPPYTDPYEISVITNRLEFFTKNGLTLNHDKNESIALIVSGSYHDQKSNYATDKYNVYQNNVYGSLMYEKDFSPMHKLSTGVSFNWDKYNEVISIPRLNHGSAYGLPDKESVTGAYAQYTFSLNNKLIVLAGLRGDYSSLYDFFITPRLHIKYDLFHGAHMRLSAGRGYRTPFILAENSYILANNRKINTPNTVEQEKAWNYGVSFNFHIPIAHENLSLAAEWFYTDFDNQMVMDMDTDPHAVSFYNSKRKSYASCYQIEASYPLFKGFTLLAAYRWNDTYTDYNGVRLRKPLTSRYKALATASYETNMRKWQFDLTAQFNGGGRMPTPAIDAATGNPLWKSSFKSYTIMNAQVTKFFRNWSVYIGGENLLNFKQKNPIISANNPYSGNFDATMVWGPTQGTKFYIGATFSIGK